MKEKPRSKALKHDEKKLKHYGKEEEHEAEMMCKDCGTKHKKGEHKK